LRIVIGEDGTLFREGLARLLEDAGHEVVAKTVDAPSLIAAVDTTLADLAIVDIRMPPRHRVGSGSPNARSKRTSPASSPSSASAQTKKTTDASSQSSPSSTTAAPRSPEGPSY
jgi:CheY-like chemotaxis protein